MFKAWSPDIEIAERVWELTDKGNNNVDIAKELSINRANVIAIKKYTAHEFYLDYNQKYDLIFSYKNKLKNCHEIYNEMLKEKAENDTEITAYSKTYFSLKPYKKYFYSAIVVSIIVGFFLGGYIERKIMESQGYTATIDQFFSVD